MALHQKENSTLTVEMLDTYAVGVGNKTLWHNDLPKILLVIIRLFVLRK